MSALSFFGKTRLAGAIAGALLAAVTGSSQAAISDDEIRIGYLDDMSGPYSDLAGPVGWRRSVWRSRTWAVRPRASRWCCSMPTTRTTLTWAQIPPGNGSTGAMWT